ncbi:MAG: tRNA epoxyqueuosine(34) reductase QueG [Omnitrophica WOR_2 bacterium]
MNSAAVDYRGLATAIKEEARRLGFHLVGVTTAEKPPHAQAFERWLAEGRNGVMAYMATERARLRRLDPRQVLPGCRTILVLGMRYPNPLPDEAISEEPDRGRVAAYAWGDDYHDVLPGRLRSLVDFIQAHAGRPVASRWYTDTGPVLERDLAQRAGLGWIGKNTCLIDPRSGSYYLLAEILLDLELKPDVPFIPDDCGSCTRCLEACPTHCILEDRTIDARRCISYLTIELKDAIPVDLRQPVGNWVFGCDICQQVCPWNRRFAELDEEQALAVESTFHPRPDVQQPHLLLDMALSQQEFTYKFKGSPVKRAKRRGYLRNVAVAIGNQYAGRQDAQAVLALGKVLEEDEEPLVRGHAAWALGQVGGEAARRELERSQEIETDEYVLEEIKSALDKMGQEQAG